MAEVTGVINSVSQSGSGFKIAEDWFNYSRNSHIANKPVRGQRVTVQYTEFQSNSGQGMVRWVDAVEILDGGAIQQQHRGGRPQRSPEETAKIERMAVLRSAATFGAGRDITSADVLKVAEYWLEWVRDV